MTNGIGETSQELERGIVVDYSPWMQETLKPLSIQMPEEAGLATLKLKVTDQSGKVLAPELHAF